MKAALPPRGVMLLAGKSVINLAEFLSVIFASEENQIPVMLYFKINPYYTTNFLLVGTLSIGIPSLTTIFFCNC